VVWKEGTTKAILKACQGVGRGLGFSCKMSGGYVGVGAPILSGCRGETQSHAWDRHFYSQNYKMAI